MSLLRLRMFGAFSVERDGTTVCRFDAEKVRELFCYLLLHRTRTHTRETLANLLWEDYPGERARKYLRQALWQLQSTLNALPVSEHGRVLDINDDQIQVYTNADLWCDVFQFEQAFERVRFTAGAPLGPSDAMLLREVIALYRGDLLQGMYQDWCLVERERLQRMYLTMLYNLMVSCETTRDYESGLRYGAQILHYDRASERTHRCLMHLHYLADDRTAALRQYEECVVALADELGVQPAKRTVALVEQIRADAVDPRLTAPFPPDAPPHVDYSTVLRHLIQLQTVLTDLQSHLQENIRVVQLTVDRRE